MGDGLQGTCMMVTLSPTTAVSPMTTPQAWSRKMPEPMLAPGWMSTANTCDVMKQTRFMIEIIMVFQQWLHCKPSGLAAALPLVMQLENDVMRIKQTASKMILSLHGARQNCIFRVCSVDARDTGPLAHHPTACACSEVQLSPSFC